MKVKDISNVIWVRIIGRDVLDIQKYVILWQAELSFIN